MNKIPISILEDIPEFVEPLKVWRLNPHYTKLLNLLMNSEFGLLSCFLSVVEEKRESDYSRYFIETDNKKEFSILLKHTKNILKNQKGIDTTDKREVELYLTTREYVLIKIFYEFERNTIFICDNCKEIDYKSEKCKTCGHKTFTITHTSNKNQIQS